MCQLPGAEPAPVRLHPVDMAVFPGAANRSKCSATGIGTLTDGQRVHASTKTTCCVVVQESGRGYDAGALTVCCRAIVKSCGPMMPIRLRKGRRGVGLTVSQKHLRQGTVLGDAAHSEIPFS